VQSLSQNNSNHALLIEISFIILTVGLILEVSLEGEEAKLRVFGNYVKSNVGSFITLAELQQDQQVLANTNVAFNIEKITKTVEGKKSFANVVNECFFVSDEDIGAACVKCVLRDDQDPPEVIGSGEILPTSGIMAGVPVTIPITITPFPFSNDVQNFHNVKLELCLVIFLILDEDAIDNDVEPNNFSSFEINDDIAEIGLRLPLPAFSGANIGDIIQLRTGDVGDEGWYAIEKTPQSWVTAGPTPNGLGNYFLAGPGLGSPDANGDRESLLDKIPHLNPLRAEGLFQLLNKDVCAVVRNSSVSIAHDNPPVGSLKGDYLGVVAFHVDLLENSSGMEGASSSTLPVATITILNPADICATRKSSVFSKTSVSMNLHPGLKFS